MREGPTACPGGRMAARGAALPWLAAAALPAAWDAARRPLWPRRRLEVPGWEISALVLEKKPA